MTRRRVIFPPTDYWTNPPKENTVTTLRPADYRRAIAAFLHHRRCDAEGLAAVFDDTDDRPAELFAAILGIGRRIARQTMTPIGLDLLTNYLDAMAAATFPGSEDLDRACRIVAADLRDDQQTAAAELATATTPEATTNTAVGILEAYHGALPVLGGPAGQDWLTRTANDLAAQEIGGRP